MADAAYIYTYEHRVRYRECDPMGVVYHTHFVDYFEAARTEALREMGLAYKALEDRGVMMPVVDLGVQFKLLLQDHQWQEAIDVGEQIVRDFPNTRMAQEVREVMDTLKQRVAAGE